MATVSEAFAQAAYHHNQGDAWRAQGKPTEAVVCYERALALVPDLCETLNNLGLALQELRRPEDAARSFQRALALKPDDAEIHGNLGNVWLDYGKLAEAIACYRRALEFEPNDATIHGRLAIALKRTGQLNLALASYQRALEIQPDHFETHFNLGIAQQEQGNLDEASACYRRALRINADFAPAYCTLGTVLKEQGQLDAAVASYHRALELRPDFPEVYCNLGSALKDQGKLVEAVACHQRALQLKPNFAEAHNNLGNTLVEQGELVQAITSLRRALELKPDFATAYNNLGNAVVKQGRPDEAALCYQQALELKPNDLTYQIHLIHQRQHLCQWDGLTELSRKAIDALEKDSPLAPGSGVPPFSFLVLSTPTTAAQQLRCAQREAAKLANYTRLLPAQPPARADKAKIKLGYLSADFHKHATAYLIAELFEQHDRERFEVIGYSYGPDDGSALRQRLIRAFDRFVDVRNASFLETAQRIRADEIDILIDLKGYAGHTRTPILAMRPAPLQVNYLGYPSTLGADFIDYILVDDFIVPLDQQPFFTERLVHLPGCYQINDRQREIAPQTPTRVDCGLPPAGFVFCDFNNSYKITPEIFSVWMDLLRAVPGSVLWLLEGNPSVPDNLRREARARGVATERLIFAPKCALPEHLARHRLADLFLDTYPVCAHTTTSDALWAGCPLLTLAGTTFVSRVAGSLLQTIGLPELVTTSLDEYKAVALRLAHDTKLLADLRARLAAGRADSSLFDATQGTRNLEEAYAAMWKIHLAGEKPRAFVVK